MSTEGYVRDETFIADAAVAAYRVVIAGETKGHVKLPAQDGLPLGITQHATDASGDQVRVRMLGVSKLEVATGNVTFGGKTSILRIHDAVGRADAQAAAWISGDGVVGYALEASAASGDIVECWLAIQTVLG